MSNAYVFTLHGELENSDIGGGSKSVSSNSTAEDKLRRDDVYNSIYNLKAATLILQ